MTYKLLKYPFKLVKLFAAILFLPFGIALSIAMSENFRDFCDAIDDWFTKFLQD